MPYGVDYGDTERRLAIAISEAGGTGGGTGGTVEVSNFPATQNVAGTVNVGNFPATQPVSSTTLATETTQSAINNKLAALNNGRIPVYRQDRAQQQNFAIASSGTQSDWFAINGDSKLVLLEVPAMTGTSLQVRWRHPAGSGTGNLIVDAFGNPFALTVGGTARTFSSDALAPLARCFLGDGEISFVSNAAEGAARTLKLYF